MTSRTKTAVIDRHRSNAALNAAVPHSMMRDLHDLSADEFMAPLDERMIASTVEALEAGQTHYVDVAGIAPLREAIATHLNTAYGSQFAPTNVLVTAGMQEGRFLTIQMIGENFGRIGIPAVAHPGVLKAAGVRALTVDTISVDSSSLLPTIDNIAAVLDAGCRLIYLESPSRLTGAAYNADEVGQIAALLEQNEASVIWDQGLAAWVDGIYASISTHAGIAERVAVIGETWPGSGLASWFVGYIAAPNAWRESMQSQKQIMAICTSTPTQYAALEASKLYAEKHPAQLQKLVEQRGKLRDLAAAAGLTAIEGDAANVLAVRAADHNRASARTKLADAGYTVGDGEAFGAPDVLRLSLTTANTAAEALQRLV